MSSRGIIIELLLTRKIRVGMDLLLNYLRVIYSLFLLPFSTSFSFRSKITIPVTVVNSRTQKLTFLDRDDWCTKVKNKDLLYTPSRRGGGRVGNPHTLESKGNKDFQLLEKFILDLFVPQFTEDGGKIYLVGVETTTTPSSTTTTTCDLDQV